MGGVKWQGIEISTMEIHYRNVYEPQTRSYFMSVVFLVLKYIV